MNRQGNQQTMPDNHQARGNAPAGGSTLTGTEDLPACLPDTRTIRRGADAPRRVALVGAGYIAEYHLAVLHDLGGVEVVGACDPNRTRLDALLARWGIPH